MRLVVQREQLVWAKPCVSNQGWLQKLGLRPLEALLWRLISTYIHGDLQWIMLPELGRGGKSASITTCSARLHLDCLSESTSIDS